MNKAILCLLAGLILFLSSAPGFTSGFFGGGGDTLPAQTDNANKFLQTDGSSTSWTTVDKAFLNLSNVENTALSTWAGSTNITTLGTITTGTWNGTTLDLSKGGTGQTTASGAINALIPTQTGNSGKVLGTNGTAVSWVAASAAACAGCVVTEIQDISGVSVDDSSDNEGADLDTWISTHKTNQILHVTPGVYDFSTSVGETGLSNFKVLCDPGAIFRKKASMDNSGNEYFFLLVQGTNVTFEGCRFEGLTTSATEYDDGEQGITCMSCNGFYVRNNYFKDIGDAAVRSTEHPTNGNPSLNTWIENNVFENIAQVTTTPASGSVKGTSNLWIVNNKFIDLKWSVKVCTRASGATGIHIIGNEIDNSSEANLTRHDTSVSATATGVGVELCGVSDVWVLNNNISNSQAAGINAYTNPSVPFFTWENYHISGNIIKDAWLGIKIWNQAGSDAGTGVVSNINVSNNIIIDTWHATNGYSIWFFDDDAGFEASQAKDNIIRNPTSGLYSTIPASGVTYADNIED